MLRGTGGLPGLLASAPKPKSAQSQKAPRKQNAYDGRRRRFAIENCRAKTVLKSRHKVPPTRPFKLKHLRIRKDPGAKAEHNTFQNMLFTHAFEKPVFHKAAHLYAKAAFFHMAAVSGEAIAPAVAPDLSR